MNRRIAGTSSRRVVWVRALARFPGNLPVDAAAAYAVPGSGDRTVAGRVVGWKVGWVGPEWRPPFAHERLVGPIFDGHLAVREPGRGARSPDFSERDSPRWKPSSSSASAWMLPLAASDWTRRTRPQGLWRAARRYRDGEQPDGDDQRTRSDCDHRGLRQQRGPAGRGGDSAAGDAQGLARNCDRQPTSMACRRARQWRIR